jgi:hypothetical protein
VFLLFASASVKGEHHNLAQVNKPIIKAVAVAAAYPRRPVICFLQPLYPGAAGFGWPAGLAD